MYVLKNYLSYTFITQKCIKETSEDTVEYIKCGASHKLLD